MTASPITPVIVVGGGPVGLAAALELARLDVPSILLERHETTSWHPKTRNFNTRTMEIARGWGRTVYARLRGIDTPTGWKSPIRFLSSVVGQEFGRIDTRGFEGPGPDVSPASPVMSSQDLIEKILRDAVEASGSVDVRFGHEMVEVKRGGEAADADVAVEVVNPATREIQTLVGSALVAADGADSGVREHLGIRLEGDTDLAYFVNCYFRADLERYVGERRGVLLFVFNADAAGVLQPLDARGRWLCQISVSAAEWAAEAFTAERCTAWIRAAVGVAGIDPEILSVGRWRMNATVASRLVAGRIVLVGDAAHQFPPTGGLGVNTGVQGMHNAMWKLALLVRGKAGRCLVDTYDAERRPVACSVAAQSLHNHRQVAQIAAAAIGLSSQTMAPDDVVAATRRYGNHLGVEFGAIYASSAVVADGTLPPEVGDDYSDYVACARPGHRAPHVWLGCGDEVLSTLDLFLQRGFTLLTPAGGERWLAAARRLAAELDVPVAGYRIGDPGLEDRDGVFSERYGLEADGAVLVRPDGYVAWRTLRLDVAAENDLRRAAGGILGHAPQRSGR